MTPFKFPPPPPPPPKATVDDAQEQYASQRGGRGGRGRGWQGRGRGNNRGGSRGGHGYDNSRGRGQAQFNGGSRGGFRHHERGVHQQPPRQFRQSSVQQPSPPSNIPLDASVKSTFANQVQYETQVQSHADPIALAQAMAFMATPAEMQTMANFAGHMANRVQPPQSPQVSPSQPPHHSPPPQGIKRKRNEYVPERRTSHTSPSAHSSNPNPKPQRAKAAAPPPIPSFGFALPTPPPPQHSNKPDAKSKIDQKKPKVHLGLSSREEDDMESSGEEDDADEEAAFAANGDSQGMVFEHEGQKISLQTPAEIAAWVRDRRKRFPTRKRIAEKEREAAKQRAIELEFLRKVQQKAKPGSEYVSNSLSKRLKEGSEDLAEKRKVVEQLRKKVEESMPAKKQSVAALNTTETKSTNEKPNRVDLGLGYGSESDADHDESSVVSDSSVLSSSEDSDLDSGSDQESSDSDVAPEEQSSNVAPPPVVVPPPISAPSLPERKKSEKQIICPFWQKHGNCKHGDRCRFSHLPKEKRLGLYERLVEQEKEKADRLALEAIKYLGRNGFLG